MTENTGLSNRQVRRLLKKTLQGDTQAFQSIVDSYQSYAYALAFRILVQQEDAEDVVQESFLRVWQHAAKYKPGVKFTTWLYSIVTNLCYDRLRIRQRQQEFSPVGYAETQEPAPLSDAAGAGLLTRIHHTLDALPDQQRIVFILRDLQDLPVKDVAQILNISENAVKSNLYYARKQLRTLLKDKRS